MQMLLSWHSKTLFHRFTESARSLLLVTLNGAVLNAMAPPTDAAALTEEEGGAGGGGALSSSGPLDHHQQQQETFFPVSSFTTGPATAFSSLVTVATGAGSTRPTQESAVGKRKKGRKKVHILSDHIPDESKTAELRAIEAFIVAHQQQMDDVELTGGEDPVILHYLITSHPSIVAHRELVKFKRRPQYIEMLSHLLTSTVSKGHFDRVTEWAAEAFQWLARRNEVLLNLKYAQRATAGGGEQAFAGKGKAAKASHLFSNVPSKVDVKKSSQRSSQSSGTLAATSKIAPVHGSRHYGTDSGEKRKSTHRYHPARGHGTSLPRAVVLQCRREAISSDRQFSFRKPLLATMCTELAAQVKLTKEDLEAKSVFVLVTKLPEAWRLHRCRSVTR